jgi:hypothetical protein
MRPVDLLNNGDAETSNGELGLFPRFRAVNTDLAAERRRFRPAYLAARAGFL